MSLPEPLPIPAALAVDEPPISDGDLAQLFDAAVALAADCAIDPDAAVEQLAADETAPRWAISDLGGAEWAMRHVAEADAELASLGAQRDEWVRRIGAWFDQATAGQLARRAFFAGHLERWGVAQRLATGKATFTVPSGVVRTRETKPKVAVRDEAAIIEWADSVLDAEAAALVAPQPAPPARKVYVQPLRDVVTITEVIDQAKLLMADGEVIEWERLPYGDPSYHRCPQPGDGWPIGAGVEDGGRLVARVEVVHAHNEVRGPNGMPVPGTYIEAGGIHPTVVAEAP